MSAMARMNTTVDTKRIHFHRARRVHRAHRDGPSARAAHDQQWRTWI